MGRHEPDAQLVFGAPVGRLEAPVREPEILGNRRDQSAYLKAEFISAQSIDPSPQMPSYHLESRRESALCSIFSSLQTLEHQLCVARCNARDANPRCKMLRSQFIYLSFSCYVKSLKNINKANCNCNQLHFLFITAFSINRFNPSSSHFRMTTTSPKVIIIGCGIAGPILTLLLKRKGYSPIVLEKVRQLGDAGSSLMLFPNGLKVLSLVGLASPVTTITPNLQALVDISYIGTEIGGTDLPSTFKEEYGQPSCGVKRSIFNLALKSALQDAGIPFIEGWKLSQIIESEISVAAASSDRQTETGSFLIGCDGIRSSTRTILLSQRGIIELEPQFTGLTQVAGI